MEDKSIECFEPENTEIKEVLKKKFWPKWLTLPRILLWSFFVLIPGIGISTAYLAKGIEAVENSINEKIDERVIKINDSLNVCQNRINRRMLMSTVKTNSYLETIMNEETRNIAESKWRRDSSIIVNTNFN
jgi:hypothetical protein